ncbi:PAS domain-containing protein [Methanimicrococcus blatticola]|uniref:PAS domain S-box-containing protein n=1 Tax=Methanimicrococcus blatticola TaxID=91560 RepID=A0A484F4Y3_9EURY|nr:PAS domain-containing protein [Methanimicrococcus blatticola]MBZ3936326.1 PAS domain S-box protein [Methanimicrococcus blatticola]MCC2508330.1 PAS domain-containing protein [Methanimicrococcus blatticola]TDQ70216.1 PAS domain S-box-containing protein [Methanimicrococcus blatticola]
MKLEMKLEYKVIILSVLVGLLFIFAELLSRYFTAGPDTGSVGESVKFLFEPMTTDEGLFFNLVILLLCFVFGVLLARLINQVLKAKGVAKQTDIEKNMILDFVPEIVIYMTAEYKIKWASRSLYTETGLSESELVGKSITDLGTKLFPSEPALELFAEFLERKEIASEIKSLKNKYWQIISNTARDEDGEVSGYVLLAIDITETKRDEEMKRVSYERLEANIEQFATVIDNIRNPLSSVFLLAETSYDHMAAEKIIEQCNEIEEVIAKLDEGWANSEEIRNFLKKHL